MLTETRILLAGLILAVLPGCYVLQAAHGEAQLLEERRPIMKVIGDSRTAPSLRLTLEDVVAARDFASRELGLPDNNSYRSYADVGRPFVVWNVVAAPEFSLKPKQWCFPIVGCVAYRGYFNERSARKFAAGLSAQGFDVVVEGVPAYSTLGKFSDPVLNTMLAYGSDELAAIIFHELAHQLIYVESDSSFNEAFATTVEAEGLKRWLEAMGRTDDLRRYRTADERQLEYIHLFLARREELRQLYTTDLPAREMRARKRALYAALAADMGALEHRQGAPSPYHDWLDEGLNNAALASVATYYDCVPGFEQMLQAVNGDLARFYADVRALARLPQAQRDAQLCQAHTVTQAEEAALSGRPSRGSD
jgi:predicted aminopeptidase